MSNYFRLTKGLNDKGDLLPITEDITPIVKKHSRKDFYRSLFKYTEEHLKQFQQTGSVKGITGLKTNLLFWDFDSNDLRRAQKDATELVARLIESGVPEDSIKTFFSGKKGFCVEFPIDHDITRQEFINVQFGLADDLETFDRRINNDSRLIRVPLTRHPESGLYKIPLEPNELATLSCDDIKEMAVNPFQFKLKEVQPLGLPDPLVDLKQQLYVNKNVQVRELNNDLTFNPAELDFSRCPAWLDKDRYALQQGYFYGSDSTDVGERNTAFLILAATYKKQGFSAEHALGLLMATSEMQAKRTKESPYTEDQMMREIVSAVYSVGWRGGTFSKDEPLLVLTRKRFNLMDEQLISTDLVPIGAVGDDFKNFAKNIERNTVKTGLKLLDDNVLITSGMMLSILAAPGAGKTSFANLFAEYLSQQGETTLYFSLDMYSNLLFARLVQKYSGYNMREILDMFKNEQPDKRLMDAYNAVITNFSNVQFNFRSGPTVEEIEQEIIKYETVSGKTPKLVIIDYLEKVRGPFADATANSAYVASRLSDIAKKYHLVLCLLCQPQKSAGDPRDQLNTYRKIKGASVIEQDSRVILTLSRPGYNPKDMSQDKFATINVVKNNMGGLCQLDFGWHGVSGSFTELDFSERTELKELRAALAEEKAGQNGFDI